MALRVTRYKYIALQMLIPYMVWAQSLVTFEAKGKKGLKDSNGNVVVPAEYDVCRNSWYGEYWIVASGGKMDKSLQYVNGIWAVLDGSGKPLFEPQSYEVSEYIYTGGSNSNLRKDKETLQGYFTIKNAEGKYGLINYTGKQIIPCIAENIGQLDLSLKENYLRLGMIPYKVNGLWGVIDVNGNEILKPEHARLENFREPSVSSNQFVVIIGKEHGKYGILSANKHVVPAVYDSIWLVDVSAKKLQRLWSNMFLDWDKRKFDILKVSKDGEEFFVNDDNLRLTNLSLKKVVAKLGDTLFINQDGKYALMKISDWSEIAPHRCNNFAPPNEDGYYHYFNHRLIPYLANGLWGVMDVQGKDVLKPEYSKLDHLSSHPDSRAVMTKGNKMGVLHAGTHVVPAIYDSIKAYDINTGEKAQIKEFDKKHLKADKPPIPLSERYLAVVLNGKSLVINSLGEEIPEEYLKKRIAEYVPPHLREPTELEKEVNKMLYKNVRPKPEYIICLYCKGTGKTDERIVTYKKCPTCDGYKKYIFFI